jgi:hypothetical protein
MCDCLQTSKHNFYEVSDFLIIIHPFVNKQQEVLSVLDKEHDHSQLSRYEQGIDKAYSYTLHTGASGLRQPHLTSFLRPRA